MTLEVEGLRALLARVDAAVEDERTLLVEVAAAFLDAGPARDDAVLCAKRTMLADDRFRRFIEAEAWTDAALHLVACVLPGWGASVAVTPDGMAQATLYPPQEAFSPFCAFADRPDGRRSAALAAALLRAKIGGSPG